MLTNISLKGHFALLILLASFITGCTSVPMPKGNSKGYSSARFVAANEPLGTDKSPVFVEANAMIKKAIINEMSTNGVKMVEGNADLIVAHLIILQDNSSTSYSKQYYGLQDFSEIVDMAHKEGMKKHYPERVQKRALVIDLIDAKTYKLVYRNFALSGSLLNIPEEERQALIDNAVKETLQQFFK